jgi:hypothetical protein
LEIEQKPALSDEPSRQEDKVEIVRADAIIPRAEPEQVIVTPVKAQIESKETTEELGQQAKVPEVS